MSNDGQPLKYRFGIRKAPEGGRGRGRGRGRGKEGKTEWERGGDAEREGPDSRRVSPE